MRCEECGKGRQVVRDHQNDLFRPSTFYHAQILECACLFVFIHQEIGLIKQEILVKYVNNSDRVHTHSLLIITKQGVRQIMKIDVNRCVS